MPSTVMDVSARLVDTMTLRTPGGAGRKILVCSSLGSCEYSGSTDSGGTSPPT